MLTTGWILVAFGPILLEWAIYVAQVSRLSYALLVPVLAGILAFLARDRKKVAFQPPLGPQAARGQLIGGLALLAGAGLLLIGGIGSVFTLSIGGFPLAIIGVVGLQGGWEALVRFRYALLLLCAIVPVPMPILDQFTPAMVQASGDTTVAMLSLIESGPITWEASLLSFRGETLLVAEACSGSGTLLALGVLSLFLAGLFEMRWWAILLTLALVLPLTLFVNGLRIALTAWALDAFGPIAVEGSAHEILGQVVVILAGAGMALLVDKLTSRKKPAARATAGAAT